MPTADLTGTVVGSSYGTFRVQTLRKSRNCRKEAELRQVDVRGRPLLSVSTTLFLLTSTNAFVTWTPSVMPESGLSVCPSPE